MPRWWSRWLWWRPPFLYGEVVLNLKSSPDEALRGVVVGVRGPWFVLINAALLKASSGPAVIDGEVVVHRSNIAFVQVLPPPQA